ncbi:MAG: OsmC family protein [Cyclobacteriaceae bacterium]|nr:OsmC family protein [Cyclobacteriaceae bacterium]
MTLVIDNMGAFMDIWKKITMSALHNYTVNLVWKDGRQGLLSSSELEQSLEVATPPPFPKGVEGVWSPEHLFTSSVSSCLMTTFLVIAENFKLEFESFNCKATGKLEKTEGRYLMTEILLEPHLVIASDEDIEKAQRVLEKAEAACLISNSIKSRVIMRPTIIVGSMA